MISVITPTYNTRPEHLLRTWNSLKYQTFKDWEWVVWDDSTNSNTWELLKSIALESKFKVSVHRSMEHSGSIGDVKRKGFMIAKGDVLVELDHDDELTPNCLTEINKAFHDPKIGFAYSDWAEILPDGRSGKYPEGWAFGYGSEYWNEKYGYWVMKTPEINRTTMSNIVSVPNHVRAWRATLYHQILGHDYRLHIADDYELIVRTVLATEVHHIPELLYIQHIGGHTAQRQQNDDIQRLVNEIATDYSEYLDERFSRKSTASGS